jgi:hypothetical protein
MRSLWPGSWINANYDTWIGEAEENTAWRYLLRAREDLGNSGLAQPDPRSPEPEQGTTAWNAFRAWEEMYAAEGSDWFWWYGDDQQAPGGDKPFDTAFISHLKDVYAFAAKAGATITSPGFPPIIQEGEGTSGGQGTMAQSTRETKSVLFTCDARSQKVARAIYIAGNQQVLGAWKPNMVRMYDDGTHGDRKAGDEVWSLDVSLPVGTLIQYKYTNSGEPGVWTPGEEFAGRNRSFTLSAGSPTPFVITDIFGK